ncbi:hypothetical protein ANN_20832 [Periplaneta americana]|uniref:Uncharacterized protein n=1 Tax=Periplaneta americana TaxID=6978 RepID=A0ABQ8SEV2_PERAM|nr:hypothetical protein ANN_20832 [Periplaneta americana]
MFENKVLRKIFGAKRDEVTEEWRKLHNTELHALYSSPDIIRNIKSRRLRWAGHVARMGESRNAYRVLVGRPEGKRPLGRPRRRWEDNIKMDLREVGYDDRDWINLAFVTVSLRRADHTTKEARNVSSVGPYSSHSIGFSGRQQSLKCAKGKRSRAVCLVVQQEEVSDVTLKRKPYNLQILHHLHGGDFAQHDFFVCGFIKGRVLTQPITTLVELQNACLAVVTKSMHRLQ